jgi:transposase
MSGDEAGRDWVWLHRFCVRQGIENSVVDAASIEVNRRSRRAQTERLEVHKRLTMRRQAAGAKQVWSVVRVPSVADADRRQRHRELLTTQRARTRVHNRIKGLLVMSVGLRIAPRCGGRSIPALCASSRSSTCGYGGKGGR